MHRLESESPVGRMVTKDDHHTFQKEGNMTLWHDMWPEISVLLFLLAWAAVIAGFMLTHW